MEILKVVFTIVLLIICAALVVTVLLQEGKSAGLGSLSGMNASDTFWSKHKGRTLEGKLEKLTKTSHIDGAAALVDAMTVRQKWYGEIGNQLLNE